eukprot:g10321.t1
MASEAKIALKIGCCVSFIAAMEIDSESLFTRFDKNAETIRVTGKLKNLKEKVGVVSIRNLEESWDVRIPKGFLRWEVPEKLFKFIDHTGKVVWDSVTDERPVVEDGDLEAFTKTPLARSVTKDSSSSLSTTSRVLLRTERIRGELRPSLLTSATCTPTPRFVSWRTFISVRRTRSKRVSTKGCWREAWHSKLSTGILSGRTLVV